MTRQPLHRRLQATWWQHSPIWRRPARRLLEALSLLRHRLRASLRRQPPRVVPVTATDEPKPYDHPAATVVGNPPLVERFLADQTETSVTGESSADAPFCLTLDDEVGDLPAALLESLLMAAATEDLGVVAGGWSPPAPGRHGPDGSVYQRRSGRFPGGLLLRSPRTGAPRRSPVVGRTVAHITEVEARLGARLSFDSMRAVGPYLLAGDTADGAVLRRSVQPLDRALASLPEVAGPRTALFLLPFLAVGGAERLLFELIDGLRERYRTLVVTLEPHRSSLGQTVDRCRELTPHVYTLGDWLPRPASLSALRHLIRRWRVEALVSWNGTVLFYDHAAALKGSFPELRILDQLYNHRGGWIERYTPQVVSAVDCHIAVNRRIAHALAADRGVAETRIVTIHHGVAIPERPAGDDQRRACRRRLGLPEDRVVVGTFIRMHSQKRPLDVLRVARRVPDAHFLLVGGGPLDATVDAELEVRPLDNLTRLPLTDADALFDALDLCLLTSSYEGLPIFLLQGLARGLPCVSTAVGDVPLLLEDGGGILVDRVGDVDALAAGVDRLLDPERRSAEGSRGRERVASDFGLDRYVQAYESVIFPAG